MTNFVDLDQLAAAIVRAWRESSGISHTFEISRTLVSRRPPSDGIETQPLPLFWFATNQA